MVNSKSSNGKSPRLRDSRGRFVKVEKKVTDESPRTFNSVAEHGEPNEEKQHQKDIFVDFLQHAVGAIVGLFIIILIFAAFCGCAPQEKVKTVYVPQVRVVNIETIVTDTIFKAPLEQSHQERVTNDTTSTLSNQYVTSTATVSDGVLTHTLDTKPDAEVEVPVQYVDRIITKIDSISYPVEVEKIVEVERKPSAIERFLLWVGAFAVIYFVVRATKLVIRLLKNSSYSFKG